MTTGQQATAVPKLIITVSVIGALIWLIVSAGDGDPMAAAILGAIAGVSILTMGFIIAMYAYRTWGTQRPGDGTQMRDELKNARQIQALQDTQNRSLAAAVRQGPPQQAVIEPPRTLVHNRDEEAGALTFSPRAFEDLVDGELTDDQ